MSLKGQLSSYSSTLNLPTRIFLQLRDTKIVSVNLGKAILSEITRRRAEIWRNLEEASFKGEARTNEFQKGNTAREARFLKCCKDFVYDNPGRNALFSILQSSSEDIHLPVRRQRARLFVAVVKQHRVLGENPAGGNRLAKMTQ